jgi:Uma2 family endonuclease
MSALPKRFFTPEEYLALELPAEYKSQYVAGEIFAMAGAQPWHINVVDNLVIALGLRFRGRQCQVFSTDLRLRVKASVRKAGVRDCGAAVESAQSTGHL